VAAEPCAKQKALAGRRAVALELAAASGRVRIALVRG
jgi:hypothetical protein